MILVGIIGRKIGMTQLFAEDGALVPVTAVEAGPCPIVQVRTEDRDGYNAIQLAFGRKSERRGRAPELGHSARAGLDYAPAILREFRLGPDDRLAEDPNTPLPPASGRGETGRAGEAEGAAAEAEGEPAEPEAAEAEGELAEPEAAEAEVGEAEVGEAAAEADAGPEVEDAENGGLRVGRVITVGMFKEGETVNVTAATKGRGFQGVVKRYGFGGRPKSHGHPSVRVPGSIGPGTDPSRVFKGRRMPGRMGNDRRTIRNMTVVRVDPDRNLLFLKGSVPGARNGWVLIDRS